jgi:protoporphyrinogen/coproporphyrinogen III oxidase
VPVTHDVLIVGGGIAGLATAYELSRRGTPFVLLEGRDRPGGVILSEEIDGLVIDGGPDSLLVQKPEGIRLCEQLGLSDRLVPTKPPRLSFIQRAGRLHALPEGSVLGIPTKWRPFLETSLFSWAGKVRMGMELFVPPKRDGEDESIGAFMTRRFGQEATDYLAEPLLAGIHAGDVNRLSLRSMFPRFAETEQKQGSLLRAFRHQPRPPAAADGAFRSLPGGLSELIRALAKALPAGSLRLSTTAQSVSFDGTTFTVFTNAGDRFPARALVLAAPAYVTTDLVTAIDPELSRLCSEVRYMSAATVAFAFRRDQIAHPLHGSGFVVPRVEKTGIMAASWLSSKWPHRAPEGTVLMRAFLGGARDPEVLDRTDAEMATAALAALGPLLGISGAPFLTRTYRWNRANAQHEVGHAARMTRIGQSLARHPGLFLTGSGFRGVGIPDCVADGRTTAAQVSQWLGTFATR